MEFEMIEKDGIIYRNRYIIYNKELIGLEQMKGLKLIVIFLLFLYLINIKAIVIQYVFQRQSSQFKTLQRMFKSNKRLTLNQKYQPVTTFLSPVQKYNQRSFSASSLHSCKARQTFEGSLRDRIRLDSFKKNVLAQSKLNKTAFNKATLKVNAESMNSIDHHIRQQNRELNIRISALQQQIQRLSDQHNNDINLLSRQHELISKLQKEIAMLTLQSKSNPCECYANEQYIHAITSLQLKVRHLQQQKSEFKQEIRRLVVKQEELKVELRRRDDRINEEVKHNRKLQDIVYDQQRQYRHLQNKAIKEQPKKSSYINKIDKSSHNFLQNYSKGEPSHLKKSTIKQCNSSDLKKRYEQYLQNTRFREIDQIQNLLQE